MRFVKFVIVALLVLIIVSTASAIELGQGTMVNKLREKITNPIVTQTTPTELQPSLGVKELSGVVFAPTDYAKKAVEDSIKDVNLPDFLKGNAFKIYILLSSKDRAILLSEQSIPTSNAKLKVIGIGSKGIRGYNWGIYYVKEIESCDTNGIPTTADAILSNPDQYKFKLLNISTHYRAISLMFYLEEQSKAIPITVGYVSDHEKTRVGFLENIEELAGKLEKSKKLDRDAVDQVLNIHKDRIGVFRIKPNYWIDADSYIKAILLSVDEFKMYMALINAQELNNIAIPKNAKMILLEVNRKIKAVPTTIFDIKTSESLNGKHVVFECIGDGFNISVKKSLEKVAMTLNPEIAEVVKACPADTIVQAEVFWYPPVPKLSEFRNYIIPAVGALGSDKVSKDAVEPIGELGKVMKIYAYVPKNRDVVVIEGKEYVGYVDPSKIANNLMQRVNDVKENVKQEVIERITSKPRFKHILPVIDPEKLTVIRVGGIVDSIKLKVKNRVENAVVEVKKLGSLQIPKPKGLVYAYIEINVSVESNNVESATISFKVSKSWLIENNVNKNEIVLMKYVNEKWITLDTKITGEDEYYVYYEAKTPSFSIYAIATKTALAKTPTTITTFTTITSYAYTSEITTTSVATTTTVTPSHTTSATTTQKTPGFELVIALMCIAIALILRKVN